MCKSEGSEGYFREILKEIQQVRPVVRKPGTFYRQRYIFQSPKIYL